MSETTNHTSAGEGQEAPKQENGEVDALTLLVESFTRRTPEEIEAARARAIATLKPKRLPEPGTTAMQHVYGQWPGNATDEEIEQILREMS